MALWWRADELKIHNHNSVTDASRLENGGPISSREVSTWSARTDAARLVEEMAASCIPIQQGERDAVDELLWLLDTEDLAPLFTLLESSPFRIGDQL